MSEQPPCGGASFPQTPILTGLKRASAPRSMRWMAADRYAGLRSLLT